LCTAVGIGDFVGEVRQFMCGVEPL
jgi:hypothetical protein